MLPGGFASIFQTIAAASMPAKVAVAAVAGVGAVAAGAPVVATITDSGAAEAEVATTEVDVGDDIVIATTTTTTIVTSTSAPPTSPPGTASTTTTEALPPERLRLSCDRVEEGDRLVIVCEWQSTQRDDVVAYVVLRDGMGVAKIEVAESDGADGMRWVDTDAPADDTIYGIHVVDQDGNVVGASNTVIVGVAPETTTTTTTTEPAPTTTGKPPSTTEPEKEEEPEWESVGIWCGRSSNEGKPGVVCEFGISDHGNFGGYVLKRNGEIIWNYGLREMPGRPWPDIRFADSAAPAGAVSYAAYVVDLDGNWIGGSATITVESSIIEEDEEEKEEEETPWEALSLGCSRGDGTSVVCEFSVSQSDGFALYVLKRNGVPILESADKNNQHLTDPTAPAEETTYTVYVLDAENNWIAGSNTVSVPALS